MCASGISSFGNLNPSSGSFNPSSNESLTIFAYSLVWLAF